MSEDVAITVENKLSKEKRCVHVYHHSTRSDHLISSDSSVTLPFGTVVQEDYLYISVARGPGNSWEDFRLELPVWADFEFSIEGNIVFSHSGARSIIRIPPGAPLWKLKMKRPAETHGAVGNRVTVGNDEPGREP